MNRRTLEKDLKVSLDLLSKSFLRGKDHLSSHKMLKGDTNPLAVELGKRQRGDEHLDYSPLRILKGRPLPCVYESPEMGLQMPFTADVPDVHSRRRKELPGRGIEIQGGETKNSPDSASFPHPPDDRKGKPKERIRLGELSRKEISSNPGTRDHLFSLSVGGDYNHLHTSGDEVGLKECTVTLTLETKTEIFPDENGLRPQRTLDHLQKGPRRSRTQSVVKAEKSKKRPKIEILKEKILFPVQRKILHFFTGTEHSLRMRIESHHTERAFRSGFLKGSGKYPLVATMETVKKPYSDSTSLG